MARARQLPRPLALDDVEDVEAFVASVVDRHWPGISDDERAENIAQGIEIAWVKFRALRPGERLSERLRLLDRWLIDAWRLRTGHKRGQTPPAVESLDALGEGSGEPLGVESSDLDTLTIAARVLIERPDDLSDPRKIGSLRDLLHSPDGRYMGVPSYGIPGALAAAEYRAARVEDDPSFK